jgi:cation:H+ antiporter
MLLFGNPTTWVTDYPTIGILCGLTFLVVGAELLVRGAVWIALTIGMSRMAVGLTLVSIGTSLPELLVTLSAADGHSDIAMGNVLGSNVANVLLIIGATAMIRAIHTKARALELGYLVVMTGLVAIPFITGAELQRWQSGLMLAVLIVFLAQLMAREKAVNKLTVEEPVIRATAAGWGSHLLMLAFGFTMLSYGAEWLVDGASALALSMGMSEAVVGITIVAIGTSMPELATSVVAALRGQPEICIGNVIGSNIFNIGAVLGGAGLLHPFAFGFSALLPSLIVSTVATILLVVALRKSSGIPRWIGALFLLAYGGYMTLSILDTLAGN